MGNVRRKIRKRQSAIGSYPYRRRLYFRIFRKYAAPLCKSIYLSALSGSGLLTILYSLQVSSDIPLSSIYSLHAPVSSKPLIWLISYVSDFFSSCLFCLFSTLIFLSSPFMFSILFVFVTPLLIIFAFASKLLSMFAPCCISGVNNPASLIDIIACKRLNVPPAPHLLPLKHLNLPVSALT